MDKFLFCYKPFEINLSFGFYQFSTRGSNCRMIRFLPTSDREWKKEFFFVSEPWAGDPIKVGSGTFPPMVSAWDSFHPKGMYPSFNSSNSSFSYLTLYAFFVAKTCPSLSNSFLDRVQRAFSFPDRSFHSLMTLDRLTCWGLDPKPPEEALSYKTTTCQSKFSFSFLLYPSFKS